MSIRMQGAWTIQVQSRNEAEGYRFIVVGADIGSGVHDGATGKMIFVRGQQWTITMQRRLRGAGWVEVEHRIGATSVSHGLVEFDIRARVHEDAPAAGGRGAEGSGLVLVCMRLAGKLEIVRRAPAEDLRACA